jgi:hypothetical protein
MPKRNRTKKVENGFNPAFPVIIWNNTLIDGHNRYSICQKHNIEFTTIEQDFASRDEAYAWIIDNQLARRNINSITRDNLIGRRYKVEKKVWGTNRYTTDK